MTCNNNNSFKKNFQNNNCMCIFSYHCFINILEKIHFLQYRIKYSLINITLIVNYTIGSNYLVMHKLDNLKRMANI